MGNHFQTVVDRDATEHEVPELADRVLQWLFDEGIISRKMSQHCVIASEPGYLPGPKHDKIVTESDPNLMAPGGVNGLEIVTEKTVFHAGQADIKLVCSSCSGRFDAPDRWGDAVGDWFDGDPGLLPCPACGEVQPITEWKHDPNWAFAYLGFTFWNWPPLTDEFVAKAGYRLGHRVVLVAGKL
ncbi:MAG: hypothetical protein ACR2PA_00770 [Hyphomicrobiaceae bacterium]